MIDFIIPYRNRPNNLNEFIQKFPDFVKSKHPNNTVTIIEQSGDWLFNFGALCNIGFDYLESSRYPNKYFAYFPIDMIPYDFEFYECNDICYLTVLDNYIYPKAFLFLKEFYKKINGFTNMLDGYGREDDDLFRRIDKFERLNKSKMECIFLEPENVPSEEFKNHYLNRNSSINSPADCGLSSIHWEKISEKNLNDVNIITAKIIKQ